MKTILRVTCVLLVGSSLLVSSGCAGKSVSLASFPAKEIDPAQKRPISAQACGFQFFMLFPFGINDRMQRAYDDLKQQAGKDLIANLTIEEFWIYGLIGTNYCTRLEAVAYQKVAGK